MEESKSCDACVGKYRAECPCPKEKCPRRGLCDLCEAFHGANGKLPYCTREKTIWDRLAKVFS
jgi:hypothetical protein